MAMAMAMTMTMTLRLTDAEAEALRSRTQLVDRVMDTELPRFAEALDRLGK